MRVVIQRVSEASVMIDGDIAGAIEHGLMLLVGFEPTDSAEDIEWMTRKVLNMRIFGDDEGLMNQSVEEAGGRILVVSQFTLHASTRKGNRPSFINAAKPDIAIPLYHQFLECLAEESGQEIHSGKFGADMKVALINDGPVTIIIDSKNKSL